MNIGVPKETPAVTPRRAIFVMEGDYERPPGQAGSLAKAGEENAGAGLEIDTYEAVE